MASLRLSCSSEVFSSPRRRAEEYLVGPSASSIRLDERRLKTPSVASGSSLQSLSAYPGGASRAWHHGLSRRLAEVQAALQDYRRRLLRCLHELSDATCGINLLAFDWIQHFAFCNLCSCRLLRIKTIFFKKGSSSQPFSLQVLAG